MTGRGRVRIAAALALWITTAGGLADAQEIQPGIYRLDGIEESLPNGDLEPLAAILSDAEMVGLGEAVHTTQGFSRAKARLFRYMVEELGFRAFGFESPWIGAERAAEYVQTCEGTPAEAIEELFGVWRNATVRDLVAWMCEYNQAHPEDPVHFYGFDVQGQSDEEVARLRALLEQMGVRTRSKRYRELEQCTSAPILQVDPEGKLNRCLAVLDNIERFLERRERRILKKISREDLEWARAHVVGLRAWEEFYFYRGPDFNRAFAARDLGMAYVAQAIRRIRFPTARTAIWAHNAHIAESDFVQQVEVMGVHLAEALGDAYATVGLVAYTASIDWRRVGCGHFQTAAQGSVEWLLRELGEPYLLIDLDFPGAAAPFLEPGQVYDLNWGTRLVPREHFDSLLYMEEAEKMVPLAWPPC